MIKFILDAIVEEVLADLEPLAVENEYKADWKIVRMPL